MADHQWENRWGVGAGYENFSEPVPCPDKPGWVTQAPLNGYENPDYYVVLDRFGNDRYEERFRGDGAKEKAEALAEEFNRFEWQGPLDPEYVERRERLMRLAPDFNRYHEGPRWAAFPARPARYLVHDLGVGWHPEDYYQLVDNLDDVKEAIAEAEANVGQVIDLDNGCEVSFERMVSVTFTET